jgi:hypothetical protein
MEMAAQRDAATNEALFAAKQVEMRDKIIDDLKILEEHSRLRVEIAERRLEEVNNYLHTVLSLLGLRNVGTVDRIAELQYQVRQRGTR